ncbi:WSC domain containing protein [Pyrenophora tritici-repentis]|uniref:WSC domain containing protein n=1 Tax=Pyrenophora tritici-repentis TaxID=45151 RepID=A0A2W1DP61_9PLEO|nr:WSC domain protein [Pyrenophora tritici-repentis]KAF7450761.1 WSC domain protein [Pyrenophora tritici-repentis]KAF7573410.1 WSC domain containing protein [Pyrenophora tritici-repentis]KAG9381024.1 WSC domain protein [Pyrenophora tritici-repentis]KAI0576743.1 WSC domain protein [Pyrenophora tritici-repentis]
MNPGSISDHVHTISGGSGFKANMTYQDTQASLCSSCSIKEDKSNYWTPQLYVKYKNGTGFAPVPVMGDGDDTNGGMTVYYLQRRGDNQTEQLHAFPEGFRMIAGDPDTRSSDGSLAAQGISFNCLGANLLETNGMPNYTCPGGLRAQVFFPQCWDGKNLDSPDHKSHMSYPSGTVYNGGNCPPTHPVHMISIFYEILYDTARFESEWDDGKNPFVFSQGDATGYGLHGDFFNGWDVEVLQKAVNTCTDMSGQVEKCAAVTMYTTEESNACKIPSSLNEQVSKNLTALPGCNTLTYGPTRATTTSAANCTSHTPTLNAAGPSDHIDLTQTKRWQYIGCGTDSVTDRAMTGAWTYNDTMTVESCINYCIAGKFSYAAPENGNECFCNNELDVKRLPKEGIMGSCAMPCVGNKEQVCGNAGSMSIYRRCEDDGGECRNNDVGGVAAAVASRSTSSSMTTVIVPAATLLGRA